MEYDGHMIYDILKKKNKLLIRLVLITTLSIAQTIFLSLLTSLKFNSL